MAQVSGRKRKAPAEGGKELRKGEWDCASCNVRNYSGRVRCHKCPMTKLESEVKTKGKSVLDWDCFRCRNSNFGWRTDCFKCKVSRDESDDRREEVEGIEWVCRFCELENFADRVECFKCKRPKDLADVKPPKRRFSPPPGMFPRSRSPMRRGYSPPPQSRYSPPRDYGRGRSPPRDFGRGRSPPRDYGPPARAARLLPSPPRRPVSPLNKAYTSQAGEKRAGDWMCPASGCTSNNFQFRTTCFKCSEKKPELDESLNITIDNITKPVNNISLSHSTRTEDPAPVKRRRVDEGAAGGYGPPQDTRDRWGTDWTCGHCLVDVLPARGECYKCGRIREDCELIGGAGPSQRDPHPRDLDPRDIGRRDPRDIGRRDPRDMGYMDPRDMGRRDPRDMGYTRDPRPRDMEPRRGPSGYTCRCGNFNRMAEPDCVRCGRINPESAPPVDRGRRDDRERDYRTDFRGGSPPRFYSDAPRSRYGRRSPERRVQQGKEVKKYEPDWKCKPCKFDNFAKRASCFKCNKKRDEVEDKKEVEEKVIENSYWLCKPCKFENFIKRTFCRKCKKTREEVGEEEVITRKERKGRKKDNLNEFEGRELPDVIAEYVAKWDAIEANPDEKLVEDDKLTLRIMFKVKRLAWKLVVKEKKGSEESEAYKKIEGEYAKLAKLHSKLLWDIRGEREGDWNCEKCEGYNFEHRKTCFKCSANKPGEESKGEASTSAASEEATTTEAASKEDIVETEVVAKETEVVKDAEIKAEEEKEEDDKMDNSDLKSPEHSNIIDNMDY